MYYTGSIIIQEDSVSDYLFVLLTGIVKLASADRIGSMTLIGIRTAGDIVGETEALTGAPPLATVTTASNVEALAVSRSELDDFFGNYPDAVLAMSRWLASGLGTLAHRFADSVTAAVPTRLARVLLNLAEQHGVQTPDGISISVPLAQSDLADLTAAARPTIQRSLADLRRRGMIVTRYRTVVITDAAALRHVAYPDSGPRTVSKRLHHLIKLKCII
jgi:CRP-like cAMP-binding protein